MRKMNAAVFYSGLPRGIYVENRTIETPSVRANEVLIEVKGAGICGSDLHEWVLDEIVKKGKNKGHIKGHEFAGEIVQTGKAVKNFQPGDRVVVDPLVPCGECLFCKQGDYNLCAEQKVVGNPDGLLQGGFAEYAPAFASQVYRLPREISYEEAPLLEPLSVALHAVGRSGCILNKTVTVLGSGTIGLCILQLAKIAGASKVFMIDIHDSFRKITDKFGADKYINAQEEDAAKKIFGLTKGLGSDIVFECVGGTSSALTQALFIVRRKGTLVLIGRFKPIAIPIDEIVAKGLDIKGSKAHLFNFPDAIRLVSTGRVKLKDLITHRFSLCQIKEAFDTAKDKNTGSLKVIIRA